MQRVGQKGEVGDFGVLGPPGLEGTEGPRGAPGPKGIEGQKGNPVSIRSSLALRGDNQIPARCVSLGTNHLDIWTLLMHKHYHGLRVYRGLRGQQVRGALWGGPVPEDL